MFYVARIYKTLNPSIVQACSNERNAHALAQILSEETGCEHMVLQCVMSISVSTTTTECCQTTDSFEEQVRELESEIQA